MPRSRELKYGFFLDDEIAELTPFARLLFQGLWCLADRDGRLEDRPARIKVQVLPFDPVDINALLDEVANARGRFIQRYEVDGRRYIQIRTLNKNQHFHPKEASSGYPEPPPAGEVPGKPGNFPARQEDSTTSPALPSLSSLPSLPSQPSQPSDPPIPPQGGQGDRNLTLVPLEAKPGALEAADVRAVVTHYQTHHPRACPNLTSKSTEWRKIKARLAEGSTVADLCKAIDGYHRHTWHVENGQLGLELIVRDASHVSQGIGWAEQKGAGPPGQPARHGHARAEDSEFTQTGRIDL